MCGILILEASKTIVLLDKTLHYFTIHKNHLKNLDKIHKYKAMNSYSGTTVQGFCLTVIPRLVEIYDNTYENQMPLNEFLCRFLTYALNFLLGTVMFNSLQSTQNSSELIADIESVLSLDYVCKAIQSQSRYRSAVLKLNEKLEQIKQPTF
jgi:hypothetical protein